MNKLGIYKVDVAFYGNIRKFSGGMAAFSSAILVWSLNQELPVEGLQVVHLALATLSIPLLIFSIILTSKILLKSEISAKAHTYAGILFSSGICASLIMYTALLVSISKWLFIALLTGIGIAAYLYRKADELIESE